MDGAPMTHKAVDIDQYDVDSLADAPDDRCRPSLAALRERNRAAIEVLDWLLEDDPAEQAETWRYLKAALDEDRPEGQQLFR
jgi:hypothetical protein